MHTQTQVTLKQKSTFGFGRILLFTIFVFVAGAIAVGLYLQNWYLKGIEKDNPGNGDLVTIDIAPGTSSNQIGILLQEKKLIQSELMWRIYVKLNNPKFLAEEYTIPNTLSIVEIAELLQKPTTNIDLWVTIQEGIRKEKVIDNFEAAADNFSAGNFKISEFTDIVNNPDKYEFSEDVEEFLAEYKPTGKSLEGFLYPETYAFEDDYDAKKVVEVILQQFIKETEGLDLNSNELSFYEVLTLASIVEWESLNETDRGLVASVFANRVEINMALQSDATVNYATGKSERRPTYADLEYDSPYNTYKYPGLPPTPIGSPRIESIKASLNPPQSEYFFFIHEEDGTPHFGKTLSDHNRNVCKYLDKTC